MRRRPETAPAGSGLPARAGRSDRGVRWSAEPGDRGTRLDRFLAADGRLGSRARARRAIERGKVFVNEREATAADAARVLAAGDVVRLWEDRPGSARASKRPYRLGALEVVFDDPALIVVNKPAGLLVVPLARRPDADTVQDKLAGHLQSRGRARALVVHRIDRDTSGLVVFARTARAQHALKAQFEERSAERTYLAVVRGHLSPADGMWRDWLVWSRDDLLQKPAARHDPRATEAVCRYHTVERLAGASLIEVTLRSGRRNQIRAQAALHGHPVVGERQYVDVEAEVGAQDVTFPRQALHAWRLAITHPDSGARLQLEAKLPRDVRGLLSRLRGTTARTARGRPAR